MILKRNYLSFLLFVVFLFTGFIYTLLILLENKSYLLAITLVILLYFVMYLLGRKISVLFLELSVLKLIRRNNGSISNEQLSNFLHGKYRRKISTEDFCLLKQTIKEKLLEQGYIIEKDHSLILVKGEKN